MSCHLRCIPLFLRTCGAVAFISGLFAIPGCEEHTTVVSAPSSHRPARLEASQLSFGEADATRDFEWTVRLANLPQVQPSS